MDNLFFINVDVRSSLRVRTSINPTDPEVNDKPPVTMRFVRLKLVISRSEPKTWPVEQ
jgi:hypothetical protein